MKITVTLRGPEEPRKSIWRVYRSLFLRKSNVQDGIAAKHCGEALRKLSENSKCIIFMYRIVASTSLSSFEDHSGLFRLLMKGIS